MSKLKHIVVVDDAEISAEMRKMMIRDALSKLGWQVTIEWIPCDADLNQHQLAEQSVIERYQAHKTGLAVFMDYGFNVAETCYTGPDFINSCLGKGVPFTIFAGISSLFSKNNKLAYGDNTLPMVNERCAKSIKDYLQTNYA